MTDAIRPPRLRAEDTGNTTAAGAEYNAVQKLQPQSDPTALAIEKSNDAMWQNISLGAFFTIAFLVRVDFRVDWYIGAMLGGYGVINLPLIFGKNRGSVGGITMLLGGGKAIGVALSALAQRYQGPGTAVVLALLLGGCVGAPSPSDARDALDRGATLINKLSHAAAGVCSIPEVREVPKAVLWCSEVGDAVNELRDIDNELSP